MCALVLFVLWLNRAAFGPIGAYFTTLALLLLTCLILVAYNILIRDICSELAGCILQAPVPEETANCILLLCTVIILPVSASNQQMYWLANTVLVVMVSTVYI
jgi:amino acid permease